MPVMTTDADAEAEVGAVKEESKDQP